MRFYEQMDTLCFTCSQGYITQPALAKCLPSSHYFIKAPCNAWWLLKYYSHLFLHASYSSFSVPPRRSHYGPSLSGDWACCPQALVPQSSFPPASIGSPSLCPTLASPHVPHISPAPTAATCPSNTNWPNTGQEEMSAASTRPHTASFLMHGHQVCCACVLGNHRTHKTCLFKRVDKRHCLQSCRFWMLHEKVKPPCCLDCKWYVKCPPASVAETASKCGQAFFIPCFLNRRWQNLKTSSARRQQKKKKQGLWRISSTCDHIKPMEIMEVMLA